jgi:IclR family transcriptional regulator, acetate operon repressor
LGKIETEVIGSDTSGKTGAPTLQTVERALMFLEFVAAREDPPTVQNVSEALGLNVTTCYHLMRTLVKQGYIKRLTRGKLIIGNAVVPLYRSYRLRLSVSQELTAIVTTLSERTGETAFFSAPQEDSVLLAVLAHGSQPLRVGGIFVGLTGNEHGRASGRAILPYLDESTRERILEKSVAQLSRHEAEHARAAYEQAAKHTKEHGWSVDNASVPGISGIGWPIFDGYAKIYGAIGLIVPTWRLERTQEKLLQELSRSATEAALMLKGNI